MAETGASILIERLLCWGVDVVFGIPADACNGMIEAIRLRQEKIRFYQVRHEEAAAFMACGYAKATGKLGVCLTTLGPGAIHLLNGLYDAKKDQVPVLALTGGAFHELIGTNYNQDVNLIQLFSDVAAYNQQILGPDHVLSTLDYACRVALSNRAVAHLNFPIDFQLQPLPKKDALPAKYKTKPYHPKYFIQPKSLPLKEELERAAAVLNEGKKSVLLVGQGARGAKKEVLEMAELLKAPIVKALQGKDVVPDDSPYTTGGLGFLGTLPSEEAMEQCDSLLIVGSNFPYTSFLPEREQAKAVQIDSNKAHLGLRYPVQVGLYGDAKETLRALLPLIKKKKDDSFLKEAQKGMEQWMRLLEKRETRGIIPLRPEELIAKMSRLLKKDAMISIDCGTVTCFGARHLQIRDEQEFYIGGNLASMAPALPYAIAHQIAFPKRQVVALTGDGGFSMLMAEFATAVKYRLPILVVILKNNLLGNIRWEQLIMGCPEYAVDLQPIDFVKFAEACGGVGFCCQTPDEVTPTFEKAFQCKGPVLIEAVTDPLAPPLPARISLEQGEELAKALLRGEPHPVRLALSLFRDKLNDWSVLFHHKKSPSE